MCVYGWGVVPQGGGGGPSLGDHPPGGGGGPSSLGWGTTRGGEGTTQVLMDNYGDLSDVQRVGLRWRGKKTGSSADIK